MYNHLINTKIKRQKLIAFIGIINFILAVSFIFCITSACQTTDTRSKTLPLKTAAPIKISINPKEKTQIRSENNLKDNNHKVKQPKQLPASKNQYNPILNETARLIAGLKIPKTSKLHSRTTNKKYIRYKKHISNLWNNFQEPNLKIIKKWRKKQIPTSHNKTIFYPFSGPDIINALTFFPNGKKYILFGLEKRGEIPNVHKTSIKSMIAGLWKLNKAFHTILSINFFRTNDMARDLGHISFSTTTGILMFFLARSDFEIVDVKYMWINEKSQIVYGKKNPKSKISIPGVEIIIRKNANSPIKRICYFSINVANGSLNTFTNFIPYLANQKRFTTIIKSASYLMHKKNRFSKIRSIILSQSDQILQDDSGIAFKFFSAKDWKFNYFGYYKKPIRFFAGFYQPKLRKNMKKHSKGSLPFSYGYMYQKYRANLLFANKIIKKRISKK